MTQQKVIQKKQESRPKIARQPGRSQISARRQDRRYLGTQGIIGNHGMLRRYGFDVIQAKLIIGSPNDRYEQEAERVAKQVIGMPEPQVSQAAMLARPVQYIGTVIPNSRNFLEASKGSGQTLTESVRAFFEPRFGYDLSHVRIHKDAQATEMVHSLSAQAFTMGREIVWDAARHSPDMGSGKQLLAHELVHVIQQRGQVLTNSHGFGPGQFYMGQAKATLIRGQAPRISMQSFDVLVQRQTAAETIDELAKEMKDDLTNNIQNFNIGLNQAVNLFESRAKSELKAESGVDRSELWAEFSLALAGLALPVIGPVIGLAKLAEPLPWIAGTTSILMNPALANDAKSANEDKIIEHAKNYFIGSKNSVSSALNNIDKKKTAAQAEARYSYEHGFPWSRIEKDQLLSWFTHLLFERNVIQNEEVNTSLVNRHAFERILRMWHLTTVARRAEAARSRAGFASGEKWDAFLKKVNQLFPDLLEQWEDINQENFEYWFGPSGESPREVKIWDLTPFRRDVSIVADIVRSREFGTSRAVTAGSAHWKVLESFWPAE